jgi:hypothetical protein
MTTYTLDILLNSAGGLPENPCLVFNTLDELVNFIRIWEAHSNQIADYLISHD